MPSKWLERHVARMTTKNGGPVPSRRHKNMISPPPPRPISAFVLNGIDTQIEFFSFLENRQINSGREKPERNSTRRKLKF